LQNHEEIKTDGLIVSDEQSQLTEPEPGLRRQVLAHTPAMMLVRHTMTKGWHGAVHAHPHEQLVYVISGRIGVSANGASFEASTGQSFIVGSNVEHMATALEDSVVLDVFTPARADYI
jgi:quercetin dioxygenase-like cupin family protein